MAHGRRKITGRATTFRDILYVLRGVTQGCAYFMECIDVAIRALEVVDEIVFAFGRGQLTVLVGAAIEAGELRRRLPGHVPGRAAFRCHYSEEESRCAAPSSP